MTTIILLGKEEQAHGETRIVAGVSMGVSGGFSFFSGNYVFVSNTPA